MSEALTQAAAVAAVPLVAAGWLAVQIAWRRAFPDPDGDPDPLAGRLGCHGCGECNDKCGRERPAGAGATGEERT